MRRLALLLGVLVVAACGGGTDVSPKEAVVRAAADTTNADTMRFTFVATMRIPAVGERPVRMTGEGAFSASGQRGRMIMDAPAFPGAPSLGEMEIVFEGETMYVRIPFLEDVLPELKPWFRADLDELAQREGFGDLPALKQLFQADPSQLLSFLRGVSDEVVERGDGEVRGVETTHYTMEVDLRRVADQAPAKDRIEVRRSVEWIIDQTGAPRLPVEVWVDEEGLIRRSTLAYRDMPLVPGQTADMTMTTELFDFGTEVRIEKPPADQVMPIQKLLELVEEGGGSA